MRNVVVVFEKKVQVTQKPSRTDIICNIVGLQRLLYIICMYACPCEKFPWTSLNPHLLKWVSHTGLGA